MLKQYIEFYYPGLFVSETSEHEVANRSDEVDLPKGAYAYRFFSREEVEQGGEVLRGKNKDFSAITYYGEIMTLEQVKALPGDYHILACNMECNGWDRVVRTVRGNFQPLTDGDIVIAPNAVLRRKPPCTEL